jgi:hypothetical protein
VQCRQQSSPPSSHTHVSILVERVCHSCNRLTSVVGFWGARGWGPGVGQACWDKDISRSVPFDAKSLYIPREDALPDALFSSVFATLAT